MINFVHGDLFRSDATVLVNPVNSVGTMGAGLAAKFKRRYPEMFASYREACHAHRVWPSSPHFWWTHDGRRVIANVATKRHWRDASTLADVRSCLDALARFVAPMGPVTVALPALGGGLGGLPAVSVYPMMREVFEPAEARVTVYEWP